MTQAQNHSCNNHTVKIQVLGSGGPELTANRASSSYLVWINNKAKILLDTGGGSSFRFGQSQANFKDLDVVLFSHFHADHSSDLPAFIKASWFGDRTKNLPVFGPYGNDFMPSTHQFLKQLFGINNGAFQYLSDMYDDENSQQYKLIAQTIKDSDATQLIFDKHNLKVWAQRVEHGPIPAFAYVIETCGKTIVFSGDTNGTGFENLSLDKTDLFIAHNAVPQSAGKIAKSLHMTPLQIGKIAKHINTKILVLSHRMKRTLGKEQQTLLEIQKNFKGKIVFADDLDIF